MPLYKLKSGKHFIRKDGEETRYEAGDIIELSKEAAEYFPDKFELMNEKVEPVSPTKREAKPVVSSLTPAKPAVSSPKPATPTPTNGSGA